MTARKATPRPAKIEPPPLTEQEQQAHDEAFAVLRAGWRHRRFEIKLAEVARSLRDAADEVERYARKVNNVQPTATAEEIGLDWRSESYSNIASQVLNTVGWMVPNLHLESLALDGAYADAARIVPELTTTEEK